MKDTLARAENKRREENNRRKGKPRTLEAARISHVIMYTVIGISSRIPPLSHVSYTLTFENFPYSRLYII